MNELTTEKTMTIREVAEVFGVSYSAIYRIVDKYFHNILANGKTTLLTESEVAVISKELKRDYHMARTFSSDEKVKNTVTELELFANYKQATEALVSFLSKKNEELQAENERNKAKIAEDAPKVDFYDRVTESPDCIDIGQCAKILNVHGIGRNKLFEILRQKKILNEHNQPYQKYVDCGYFRIIETSFNLPDGTQKINLKTVVFQRGLDFIRKMIEVAK